MTERMRLQIQEAEMSFPLQNGLTLIDRVKSPDIRRELREKAAAPLRLKEPVQVVRASD